LINALAWAGERTTPAQGERLLTFAIDGLRPSTQP
jgi:hypothetical protein